MQGFETASAGSGAKALLTKPAESTTPFHCPQLRVAQASRLKNRTGEPAKRRNGGGIYRGGVEDTKGRPFSSFTHHLAFWH